MTNTIAQAAVGRRAGPDDPRGGRNDPRSTPTRASPGSVKGEITFDNVAFAYKPDSPVLKEITSTIKPGQLVGFVGATGGGKSTVASLIPRFYDATAGRVLIDGIDVRDFKLKPPPQPDRLRPPGHRPLRRARSPTTSPTAGRAPPREEIVAAAKLANADEFIAKMPKGYDSDGRRARHDALRRPAAAHRHRPRDHPQLADPHPRRADRRARHRVREGRDGGARAPDEGPHGDHDRPPPLAPSATPTRSSSSRTASSTSRARTTSCSNERRLRRALPRSSSRPRPPSPPGASRPRSDLSAAAHGIRTHVPLSHRASRRRRHADPRRDRRAPRSRSAIKMFVFSDPALLEAVIAAHRAASRCGSCSTPRAAAAKRTTRPRARSSHAAGVEVKDSNPAVDLTHEKSMVVDDAVAFVKSLNWATEEPDRDPRLRRRDQSQARGRRDHRLLRGRLAPQESSSRATRPT